MISEPMHRARPRVAIVSDPLVQRGGAERCVEAMAEAFPDAPVFALLYSAETGPASLAARVVPTWLNRLPGAARRHRAFLPRRDREHRSERRRRDPLLPPHGGEGSAAARGPGPRVLLPHADARAVGVAARRDRIRPRARAPGRAGAVL